MTPRTTRWLGQFILGDLPLLAASAMFERNQSITWSVRFLAILLVLALVGTAAATAAWYSPLLREDPGRLSLFLFLVPVAGLALSAAVYDEAIDPLELAGIVFVFAAVAVAIGRSWHAAPPVAFALLPIGVDERN